MAHVYPPLLDDTCVALALSYASRLTNEHFAFECPHTGTFAYVVVRDGLVVEWTLRGPGLTPEQLLEARDEFKQAARLANFPLVDAQRTN